MNEKIKQEALLSEYEAFRAIYGKIVAEALLRIDWRASLPNLAEFIDKLLPAQLEKLLKHKKVRIEAENQELPENPCDMLTPDKDGNVWVNCLERKEK